MDKTIKVQVSFTDDLGNAEGPLVSDAYPAGNATITAANTAPAFGEGASTDREVAENTGPGTDIGGAVSATDAEDDTLEYSLEGTDAASFDVDPGTGPLRTRTGVDYNHEAAKNSYSVTVKADDGNGDTATIAVTVNVTDVAEKAARPDAPDVTPTPGSTTSLNVNWTKPDLRGLPRRPPSEPLRSRRTRHMTSSTDSV